MYRTTREKSIEAITAFLLLFGLIIWNCSIGVLAGAFVGWIITLIGIGSWVKIALESFHVSNISLVDFGALLGFIGGFLRK